MGDGGPGGAAKRLLVLRGMVTKATGEPVADARVALAAGPRALPDVAALTGPDGTFAFGALPPGRYRVEAFGDATQAFADIDLVVEPVDPLVLVLE
ncbi:MAG: carboxypeptidase-like regulatory domain-containing protein [Ornithinimicrobium sp.]